MSKLIQLPKSIKRITLVQQSQEYGQSSLELYQARGKKKKKKKQTRGLRIFERLARRSARANQTFAGTYMGRHDRSNRKRRDGWLRDMGPNVFKANRKAMKRLRMRNMLPGF